MPVASKPAPAAQAPGNVIRFTKFPIETIKDYRVILVVGKRGSGKTTLIKTILWHLKGRVDHVIAFLGSQETVAEFTDFIPECQVYGAFDAEKLRSLIELQEIWWKRSKPKDGSHNTSYRPKCVLVLMDDMFGKDKNWLKEPAMVDLHMNGRHYGIPFLNAAQYMMDIPIGIRMQIDYVFAFYDPKPTMMKRMYDNFGGQFAQRDFEVIYKELGSNHRCMVLDNTCKTTNPTEMVYYFQANIHLGPFTIGSDSMWKLALMFSKTHGRLMQETEEAYNQKKNVIFNRLNAGSGPNGPRIKNGAVVYVEDEPVKGRAAPKGRGGAGAARARKPAASARGVRAVVDEEEGLGATDGIVPRTGAGIRSRTTRGRTAAAVMAPNTIRLDGADMSIVMEDALEDQQQQQQPHQMASATAAMSTPSMPSSSSRSSHFGRVGGSSRRF